MAQKEQHLICSFFFFLINKCVVFNFDQKEELTFGLSCQEVISEPLEGHA